MAEGLNRVMLLGNLGADPELRMTPSGQPVLNLRLATTESYLDKNNTRQERTDWHSVTVWGKRGEALSKILAKGSNIFVEGSIRTSSYEKNGEKRYRTEIVANNIILTGRRGDSSGQWSAQGADAASGAREFDAPRSARAAGGAARVPQAAPVAEGDFEAGLGADEDIPF